MATLLPMKTPSVASSFFPVKSWMQLIGLAQNSWPAFWRNIEKPITSKNTPMVKKVTIREWSFVFRFVPLAAVLFFLGITYRLGNLG